LADRMSNAIKNGLFCDNSDKTFEEARKCVEKAISLYKLTRPHQVLGMNTLMQMFFGEQKKL